jgi:hypothetical protein
MASKVPVYSPKSLIAPVPGMSLTTEPGNRPWENPPQLVSVDDAIEFYAEKILDPDKADAILNAMDEEVSIESMADMLTTSAVMDGIHTIDISILVMPVVQEMLRYVGDLNEIKYIDSYEELDKKNKISIVQAKKLAREAIKSKGIGIDLPASVTKKMDVEEEAAPEEKPRAGLMAKRIQSEEQ